MSLVVQLGTDADHVLRLYARLADVSARILACAEVGDWEAVDGAQTELVELTTRMTQVEESAGELDELQKTSRILYLTAALEDQRKATECLAAQSLQAKKEAGSLLAADRLKRYATSSDQ